MKDVLKWFERQILLFPLVVVLLTAITLLLGGHCAAWQWWLSGVVVSGGCIDVVTYHLPAIRMLIQGWNPVYAATPEAYAGVMSVELSELWPWHILAMTKSVWYFNAVAHFFVHEPFNLLFPLLVPMLISSMWSGWHFCRESPWYVRILVMVATAVLTPTYTTTIVDTTVGLAGIGLILTMGEVLLYKEWHWLRLFVFSFWMCTSKHLGMESCFVFWVVFALVSIRSWVMLRRFCVLGLLLLLAIAIVCASPYFTSWKEYGHPLYPVYSCNEEIFPSHSMTSDFLDRNEDAASMGRIGAYVNAYISSSLAHAYYKFKNGKDAFSPRSVRWNDAGGPDAGSPTAPRMKVIFCLSVLLTVLLGSSAHRVLVCMPILAMGAMPTEMIGYMRYSPWWGVLLIVAFDAVVRNAGKWRLVIGTVIFTLFPVCVVFWQWSLMNAFRIDHRLALNAILRDSPPQTLSVQTGAYEKSVANLRLVKRMVSELKGTELRCVSKDVVYSGKFDEFPDFSGYVPVEDGVGKRLAFSKLRKGAGRIERYAFYPAYILKMYSFGVPKLIGEKLCSLIR